MESPDTQSDAELLRASARDPEAFGVFFDRYGSAVFGYFLSRTADRALAHDLTSETFANAFASRRRYRDVGKPASGWLFELTP